VQATVIPGCGAIPKIAPIGGTFLSRKLTQVITQPVSPGEAQVGVDDISLIRPDMPADVHLTAYKQRMGWQFPYVSTYGTDFPFDFGLALTPEQAQAIPPVKEMIDNPPEWVVQWSEQIGAKLEDGLREGPSWIAFARENGTVYHTYTVTAPDPFVAPYHSFLERRTPKGGGDEVSVRRKDEYPD